MHANYGILLLIYSPTGKWEGKTGSSLIWPLNPPFSSKVHGVLESKWSLRLPYCSKLTTDCCPWINIILVRHLVITAFNFALESPSKVSVLLCNKDDMKVNMQLWKSRLLSHSVPVNFESISGSRINYKLYIWHPS